MTQNRAARSYKIAPISGDGIGPEVIAAGMEVLQMFAVRCGSFVLEVESFPWGSAHFVERGCYEVVSGSGVHTAGLGGTSTTAQVAAAVCREIGVGAA